MSEKIEVGYTRAAGVGGFGIFHKYILYTNSAGERFYARGGPGYFGPGAADGGTSEASTSPFGNIKTKDGEYNQGTPDWDFARDPNNTNPDIAPHPREVITEGNDLGPTWDRIKEIMRDVDSRDIPYNPKSTNSNASVDEAIRRAGLPSPQLDVPGQYWAPGSDFDMPGGDVSPSGEVFPGGRSFWEELLDWTRSKFPNIDKAINDFFTAARNLVIRRDPLVLDLDGDGLELLPASGAILFDHNADGIKTGTGWVHPNDGFLVRDLNGNGVIDTGRELFGEDTLKSNGALAAEGFDALRELDSNSDGQITNLDTAFNELKVWRDLNQDGISQANELSTLGQLNITSINTNGTDAGPQARQLINNNRVALSSTFTQNTTDGQVSRTVGAIDLEFNSFFAQFPLGEPVAITAQAQALPQMNGAGMVRNMREAASLDGDFAAALSSFASGGTRDGQRGMLNDLKLPCVVVDRYWQRPSFQIRPSSKICSNRALKI